MGIVNSVIQPFEGWPRKNELNEGIGEVIIVRLRGEVITFSLRETGDASSYIFSFQANNLIPQECRILLDIGACDYFLVLDNRSLRLNSGHIRGRCTKHKWEHFAERFGAPDSAHAIGGQSASHPGAHRTANLDRFVSTVLTGFGIKLQPVPQKEHRTVDSKNALNPLKCPTRKASCQLWPPRALSEKATLVPRLSVICPPHCTAFR